MFRQEKGKANVLLFVIIAIAVVALVGVGIFFVLKNSDSTSTGAGLFSKNIRSETITAENFEEMMTRLDNEMEGEDDLYYLSYSIMYYMVQDGMEASTDPEADESATYARIYGKTVETLINEGKQLMSDNDITVEEYKKVIDQAGDTLQ